MTVDPTINRDLSEIVTGVLDPSVLADQIRLSIEMLIAMDVEEVMLMYGWGCDLGPDEMWVDQEINVRNLQRAIDKSIAEGIFRPGVGDVFVSDRVKSFELLFCHESDIHLNTEKPELLGSFQTLCAEQSITLRRRGSEGAWTEI